MKTRSTLASLAGALMLACLSTTAAAQPGAFGAGDLTGGWENRGGQLTSRPVCVNSGYGRIDCLARDGDGALAHLWRNRDEPWSGWQSLGGQITGAPECVVWNNRRMDCYAQGTDGALWRRTFQATYWTDWESLGGIIDGAGFEGPISCTYRSARSGDSATGQDPHLIDCFVRGTDGALWRRALNGETWSDWQNLEGVLTTPPECVASGPRINCFARGTDNAMWRRAFNGTSWANWESLGGILTSEIDCVSRDSQRIDCFVRGTDNAIWRRSLAGSTWRDWQQVGGVVDAAGFNCMKTLSNDLQCYAIMNGNLQRRVLAGSTWRNWETVGGGVTGRPDCVAGMSNRIDCFATAGNGALQNRWWNGSSWQPNLPAQVFETSP